MLDMHEVIGSSPTIPTSTRKGMTLVMPFFACWWGCSKGANRRGAAAAVRARERPSAATLCRGSRRETATRSIRRSADSSPARRHGRRRASLAAPPAAPAAPLPKNLAALRFSGALFYLLRGFGGGGLPSPIWKKPPCMGGFFNIK